MPGWGLLVAHWLVLQGVLALAVIPKTTDDLDNADIEESDEGSDGAAVVQGAAHPHGKEGEEDVRDILKDTNTGRMSFEEYVAGSSCPKAVYEMPPPAGVAQPSAGCVGGGSAWCRHQDSVRRRTVAVHQPELNETLQRQFLIDLPRNCFDSGGFRYPQPSPLVLWFHGQYGGDQDEFDGFGNSSGYRDCARATGTVGVYMQGTDDFYNGTTVSNGVKSSNGKAWLGTGWNVGSSPDESVCITASQARRPYPTQDFADTEYSCYASCLKLGKCGRCNWSTCNDDIAYVKAVLTKVASENCIDLSRIYVGGQSNGGMMMHYVSHKLPNTFAAFQPLYGLPLYGYAAGKNSELLRNFMDMREASFMALHDRGDRIIPFKGGLAMYSKWTWYYSSLREVVSLWAGIHSCSTETSELTLPFEVRDDMACYEHLDCTSGKRVVYCLYDGYHGQWPTNLTGSAAFWMFNQNRRHKPVSW